MAALAAPHSRRPVAAACRRRGRVGKRPWRQWRRHARRRARRRLRRRDRRRDPPSPPHQGPRRAAAAAAVVVGSSWTSAPSTHRALKPSVPPPPLGRSRRKRRRARQRSQHLNRHQHSAAGGQGPGRQRGRRGARAVAAPVPRLSVQRGSCRATGGDSSRLRTARRQGGPSSTECAWSNAPPRMVQAPPHRDGQWSPQMSSGSRPWCAGLTSLYRSAAGECLVVGRTSPSLCCAAAAPLLAPMPGFEVAVQLGCGAGWCLPCGS
mmetsp:Transcript_25975/g.54928  ORF Transcript_25975/g.54928 Transcript_25975/m.54928 type:complete len:264 (-) Transcript_25975:139-930(-)